MPVLKDNNEPLVDLKKACPKLLFDLDRNRIKVEKTAFARKTVAKRLNRAISLLPLGLTFILVDAWRPQHIQEKHIRWYTKFLANKNRSWSKARVATEVKNYVHPSKGAYASGHLTGGALDISLAYKRGGKRLPLKSGKLTFQENALSHQSKLPGRIRKNREVMFTALLNAGFVNYHKEYWHWSYGDIRWAEITKNRRALYDINLKGFKK